MQFKKKRNKTWQIYKMFNKSRNFTEEKEKVGTSTSATVD